MIGNPLCPLPMPSNFAKKQPQVENDGLNEVSYESNEKKKQVSFADVQSIKSSEREDTTLSGAAATETAIQLLNDEDYSAFASQKYR